MDIYQTAIIDEAKHPRNQGELENPDVNHHETNASCGDDVTVTLKLSKDKQVVEDIKWVGSGCVVSQASMSVFSDKVKGAKVSEIKKWVKQDLLPFFGMEEISAGREKCFMMGLKAVQKALSNL